MSFRETGEDQRRESIFLPGSRRYLVNRRNISSSGEEEYFPWGSERTLMNRRNISSREAEET
jgi:hypothetical protein